MHQNKIILWSFAGVMAFFASTLGGVTFVGLRYDRPSNLTSCRNDDADIVGDVSMSAALMISFGRRQLSPVDAILGSMILDAQNNTLSIQLATKETLAARWQVSTVLSAQLFGLVVQGILIGSFSNGSFLTEDCECFSVFWWAWFSNCLTTVQNEVIPFWIYYGLRWLAFIHCSSIYILLAPQFDEAERRGRLIPVYSRGTQCPEQNNAQSQPAQVEHEGSNGEGSKDNMLGNDRSRDKELQDWSEIPPTHTLMFLEYSMFAVLSMYSAEALMAVHRIQKSSPVYSIGQVTALVVAGGTTVRAIWVCIF